MLTSLGQVSQVDADSLYRLICFVSALLVMFIAETLWPRRRQEIRLYRWSQNLSLTVIDGVITRVLLPGATIAVAIFASEQKIGLWHWLHLSDSINGVINIATSVVLLDMVIYWQHRIFHRFDLLWRLHKVHHTDTELDASSGSRFHPLEILLSLLLKMLVIITFGIPAEAVLIFEILLNVTAVFNHSNIRLPLQIDKLLRYLLVTPDMHRVHHSVYGDEHNRNFGFALSIWDRLFASYCPQPKDGHGDMKIGLSDFRQVRDQRIDKLLAQPFTPSPSRKDSEF